MVELITCHICGTKRKGELYTECPYCGWGFSDFEGVLAEDKEEPFNRMTVKEAKALLRKGLNIWGDPLPSKK